MRVMVLVSATEASEAGVMPTTDELNEMGEFNAKLVKAGVMLAGDGLKPTSKGKRVAFDADNKSTVLDGPFAESKEIVAGFWIWSVSSMEEAVEWLKQAPFRGQAIDIRPFYEPEDFGDNFTPEMREAEAKLRAHAEEQHGE